MKQLTKKQAIAIFNGGEWKDWSDEEVVKFQLYQDRLCVPFGRFHEAIEKVFGRPIWTHEFSRSNYQNLIDEYEGKRKSPTFEEILSLIPEEKRIVLTV